MDISETSNVGKSEPDEEELVEISQEEILSFSSDQVKGVVHAILVATSEPISLERLEEVTKLSAEDLQIALRQLIDECDAPSSGVEIIKVAGEKYQLRTRARYARFITALKATSPRRLSHAALETIAIVAYKQPIVKSEIERVRGVDSTPVLKTLLEKRLIKIVGHQATAGQPALYGTTDEFLKLFGMASLSELPSLRELKEFEQDPGEVATSV
jgi:segregation and condensation protein B